MPDQTNNLLLREIKSRSEKQTEFWHGISTADRYVKTVQDCVGLEACYKFACHKGANQSFGDALTKASKTLVYANEDMEVKDVYKKKSQILSEYKGLELPKNTLMVFKHVLTSSRKDRDGDILHPAGAELDPKMLMLFNHIHTLPIGKLLAIDSRDRKTVTVISAIIDLNELANDCAKMIDNDMGRYSHGFRAIEFVKIKEMEGNTSGQPGFEVLKYEVMEESLVSVPSNKDAETQEVILSLVEGGKMKSGLMKEFGRQIREKMPASSAGGLDPKEFESHLLEDSKHADKSGTGGDAATDCGCGAAKGETCKCSSEKTDDTPREESEISKSTEMKTKMMGVVEGSWEYVGHKLRNQIKDHLHLGERAYAWTVATFSDHVIVSVDDGPNSEPKYFQIDWKMEGDKPVLFGDPVEVEIETTTAIRRRSPKARRKRALKNLKKRLTPSVKQAMAVIATNATPAERDRLKSILEGIEKVETLNKKADQFRQLTKVS